MSTIHPPQLAPHITGLSRQQAQSLYKDGQNNAIPSRSARSYTRIILDNVFTLFNVILISSIILVLYLGGSKDVLFVSLLLLFNISSSLIQEVKARRTLDQLSAATPTQAVVRRDGQDLTIPVDQIVLGDIVIITPGQSISVDGTLLSAEALEVNESSLTGESHDVPKKANQKLTSGSYCTAGIGVMKAEKVGQQSYINQTVQSAKAFTRTTTPVQRRINLVLRYMIVAIAIFAPLTLVSGVAIQLPLAASVENMVTLLTSLVPQGLIASMAMLYLYGAIRISRSGALVQKINAVESLGAATVVCTDKTGTLTQNKLQVIDLLPSQDITKDQLQQLLGQFAVATTSPNSTIRALLSLVGTDHPVAKVVARVSFKSQLRWSGLTVTSTKPKTEHSYILGAPEVILPAADFKQSQSIIQQQTQQGRRVLAFVQQSLRLKPSAPQLADSRQMLGLVVLGDQIRPNVQHAIHSFQQAEVGLKVISGDNPDTVQAIASQAGLKSSGVVTQAELEKATPAEFDQLVYHNTIFARIAPATKKKIVQSLRQSGQHVAMIGDGINDVAALKQANIAIALQGGTQITKDIADLTLLGDDFTVLPKAVEEGRDISQRIYAIAKIFFIKAIYLMILFVLVGFASLPFPLDIRQTTLLGFVITGVPIVFITLKQIDVAKPRDPTWDFLSHVLIGGVVGGLAIAYLSIVSTTIFGQTEEASQTMVTFFATLYSSIILWQVSGMSLWDFILVRRMKQLFYLIFLTLFAVLLPIAWAASLFLLVSLSGSLTIFIIALAGFCGLTVLYLRQKLTRQWFKGLATAFVDQDVKV